MPDATPAADFDPIAALRQLSERGLTFSHAVEFFGESVEDNAHARYAREQYQRDGELEFDDNVVVSDGGDGGAYVQCWRWVYDEDAGVDRDAG